MVLKLDDEEEDADNEREFEAATTPSANNFMMNKIKMRSLKWLFLFGMRVRYNELMGFHRIQFS